MIRLGLLDLLRASLRAHDLRPHLAPGAALRALVDAAGDAEEAARAEGWEALPARPWGEPEDQPDLPGQTLADLVKALTAQLRGAREEGQYCASSLRAAQEDRQALRASGAELQRQLGALEEARTRETSALTEQVSNLLSQTQVLKEDRERIRVERDKALKDVDFYVREGKGFADQRDHALAQVEELRAQIAEAEFFLKTAAHWEGAPDRKAGLIALAKAVTDHEVKLMERIDRLVAALLQDRRCHSGSASAADCGPDGLLPGDLDL